MEANTLGETGPGVKRRLDERQEYDLGGVQKNSCIYADKNETSSISSRRTKGNQFVSSMKKTARALLSIAGFLLIASPFVRADEPAAGTPPPPPPGEKGDKRERRQEMRDMRENSEQMAKELNLTADQKIQIDAIRKQTRESMKALRNDTSLTEDQKRERATQNVQSSLNDSRCFGRVITVQQIGIQNWVVGWFVAALRPVLGKDVK